MYRNGVFEDSELYEIVDGKNQFPADCGVVDVLRQKSDGRIDYYDWSLMFNEDIDARKSRNKGKDEIQIFFNLNQDIQWNKGREYENNYQQISMNRGEVCIYRNNDESTSMRYKGGTVFKFKSLQMETDIFEDLLVKYFPDINTEQMKKYLYSKVSKTSITPDMYRILSEIDSAYRYKEFKGIFLEGKMIELTALVLYGIFHSGEKMALDIDRIDDDDIKVMEELRERIQLNPYEDFGQFKVAQEVGISKSKLTRLFRSLYGVSLHEYVQDQRLEYAASLLSAGGLSVTNVAIKSGYNNMSYFSKSFTKKYGISPKRYSVKQAAERKKTLSKSVKK